ncbi:alpha/beta hydrolase [Spiroplasma endosymbiont of Crioceris asparagi]|uniref:alpha/beta hydrolase n=1 Tax=Spiroplasma endosymbiont of Crioceris asparagi TaxID=3066286 RepID=UPI0030D1FE9B
MNEFLLNSVWAVLNSKIITKRDNSVECQLKHFKSLKRIVNIHDVDKTRLLDLGEYHEWQQIELFTSDDIELAGMYWINPIKTDKWIISLHGFSSKKEVAATAASFFKAMGYNIFAFDFRNQGMSSEDFVTFGVKEQEDLLTALKYLRKEFHPTTVGLIGFSMGAYALNAFALNNEPVFQEYNIKFGISDSTFANLSPAISRLTETFGHHLKVSRKIIDNMLVWVKNRYMINTEMLNLSNFNLNNVTSFPILYLHSKDDKITSYKDSEKFIKERKSVKVLGKDNIVLFTKVGHIKAIFDVTQQYVDAVKQFLQENQVN